MRFFEQLDGSIRIQVLAQLEKKRRAVDASEKRCIDEALVHSRDKIAGMAATPGASP